MSYSLLAEPLRPTADAAAPSGDRAALNRGISDATDAYDVWAIA